MICRSAEAMTTAKRGKTEKREEKRRTGWR
jgi:hypothetical protein